MTTKLQTEQGIVRVPTGTWEIDPIHSSISFEVKHMMISTVRGQFKQFEGTLEAAEDYHDSRVWGSVQVASLDTGNADRDEHLLSPDFFDAAHHPQITFRSTAIEHVVLGTYRVGGDLTIKDVTREVQVEASVEGSAVDPWGNDRVGIAVRGSIDRTDFGLTWQQSLVGGGLLVGEQVALRFDISAVRA
ncbi:MAG TPA: YceI family protein [Solirubrobacterales bacterium]|jgi:polyisoprenoid-binding protein YceI|nr:YceI family protein [Solirubrobacterales bacterium]